MAYKTREEFEAAVNNLRGKTLDELDEGYEYGDLAANACVSNLAGEKYDNYTKDEWSLLSTGISDGIRRTGAVLIRPDPDSDPYMLTIEDDKIKVSEHPVSAAEFETRFPLGFMRKPEQPGWFYRFCHGVSKFFGGTGLDRVNSYNDKKALYDEYMLEKQRAAGYRIETPDNVRRWEKEMIADCYFGGKNIGSDRAPKHGKTFDRLVDDPRMEELRQDADGRAYVDTYLGTQRTIMTKGYIDDDMEEAVRDAAQRTAQVAVGYIDGNAADEESEAEEPEEQADAEQSARDRRNDAILRRAARVVDADENPEFLREMDQVLRGQDTDDVRDMLMRYTPSDFAKLCARWNREDDLDLDATLRAAAQKAAEKDGDRPEKKAAEAQAEKQPEQPRNLPGRH